MSKDVIIVEAHAGTQGVRIKTNKPAVIDGGRMACDEHWVSWDKIGNLLFADYTQAETVAEMRMLRGETSHD